MIYLHRHQETFVNDIRASMKRGHKAICAVAPTGMGKTVCAAYMISEAVRRGKRLHFLVHRKELIKQTANTLDQFNVPYSYIAAGFSYNPYARVHICSVDTLRNRLTRIQSPDVSMFDEGHLACSPTWSQAIDYYKAAGSWVLTFTATPIRTDGTGLGKHFTDMVLGPDVAWLMENGFLSRYKMYSPSTPDLSGIASRAGDYAKDQLSLRMEADNVLIGDAVRHYQKYAAGKRAVAYCVSRKHSGAVAEQFLAAGISARHIDGETPMDERVSIIRAFARGEIMVLTNVALVSTGFDLAASAKMDVTVDCIIDLAPTKSLSLCLQKWGRALRRKDYPAILLDHAGNFTRHGMPDDKREWTLADSERCGPGAGGENSIPTKQCSRCYFVSRPTLVCPNCGHVHEIQARVLEHIDGELSEVSAADRSKVTPQQEQGMARTLEELIALARRRNYSAPEAWAARVFTSRKASENKKRGADGQTVKQMDLMKFLKGHFAEGGCEIRLVEITERTGMKDLSSTVDALAASGFLEIGRVNNAKAVAGVLK